MDACRALVEAEDGDFSFRNAIIAERDGAAAGGLIGYNLPTIQQPVEQDVPEAFVGIEKLAQLVPRYLYINFMAAVPDSRKHDVGSDLLVEAEKKARKCSCPGLALIVAASNEVAMRVYRQAGFAERARRPFDLSDFGEASTEAILMVKDCDW